MEQEMNGQLDFDAVAHTHRGDPGTSHEAAAKAAGTAQAHCDRIASQLDLWPNGGLTASEVARFTGLEMVQVNRRISDLIRDGRAHRRVAHWLPSGRPVFDRRSNRKGNMETVIYPGEAP